MHVDSHDAVLASLKDLETCLFLKCIY